MRRGLLLVLIALCAASARAEEGAFARPEPVRIEGYGGEAMEPFLARDGRFLFFNTRNDPGIDTDIHVAVRRDDLRFVYRRILEGTRSPVLDGVPTLSADGRFCFISPRDYRRTLVSVLCGQFDGARVRDVVPAVGLRTARLGRIVFDVELAADGRMMIFAEGSFSGRPEPDDADLFLARLGAGGFERAPESAAVLANVNTRDLEYAAALSSDGRELFFTRISGAGARREIGIYRASRPRADAAFGPGARIAAITGFAEAPTLSPDGRALHFHRRVDGRFSIWRVTR